MATQLTTIRTDVRNRLGVPSDDSFFTDAVLTDLINQSINWLSFQWDWPWLEKSETVVCADADSDYALASDYSSTIAVTDSTGVSLVEEPDFRRLLLMTTAKAATPRFFTIYANELHVRPVPNGTFNLTHYYRAAETALSSDSDTPLLPDQYLETAVTYAAYLAQLRAGNIAEADKRLAEANDLVKAMKMSADRYAETTGGGAQPETGQ